jgi:hypothetical protein
MLQEVLGMPSPRYLCSVILEMLRRVGELNCLLRGFWGALKGEEFRNVRRGRHQKLTHSFEEETQRGYGLPAEV